MLKNIKISAEIHQEISIKAAELDMKKGELTEKLLESALEELSKKEEKKKIKKESKNPQQPVA
jgi:hypothetical protein